MVKDSKLAKFRVMELHIESGTGSVGPRLWKPRVHGLHAAKKKFN